MDWAGIWKRNLEEKHLSLYRQWSRDGSLERRAKEVAQQANRAVSHLVNQELSHCRLPSGFVAAAGAMNAIYAQARETVLHDVVLS